MNSICVILCCTFPVSFFYYRIWLPNIISDYDIILPEAIEVFIDTAFPSKDHYRLFVEQVEGHEVEAAAAQFRKDVPLRSLKQYVATLKDVMEPLEDCMEEMVFLHSRDSHLFKMHMHLALRRGSQQLSFEVY